jgi:hypothetical protein
MIYHTQAFEAKTQNIKHQKMYLSILHKLIY